MSAPIYTATDVRGMTLRQLAANVERIVGGIKTIEAELLRRLRAGRPLEEPCP